MAGGCISLRGVAVHNLKHVDLDLPHRQLIVLCGLSGSGKTSLALDTLYAEGQRRYIESFSTYHRQFLEQLEKPDAERIEGIPAAIAVTYRDASRSSRATIGSATETIDYLRLLYAKIGRVVCPDCREVVRRETPQSAAELLASIPPGTRFQIAFQVHAADNGAAAWQRWRERGFIRAIVGGQSIKLADRPATLEGPLPDDALLVVDRLAAGGEPSRLRDSLETAFSEGQGTCVVLVEGDGGSVPAGVHAVPLEVDGGPWRQLRLSGELRCAGCGREFPRPEPRLFSFNSPLGACPACEGFGNVMDIDMDLVVPDPAKSIREGAIAPWTTPAYAHELEELLALAPDYDLPVDVPFRDLDERQRRWIVEGVPERKFGGLRGFFAWLERRKYKMHLRVFLARWRTYRICPACDGSRLRPESLDTRLGGRNIAELSGLRIRQALALLRELELSPWERQVGRAMLEQVCQRLAYLEQIGLGYLSLDRTLRTLSSGEAQRVKLTGALGSSLVNMLYVLDEPSVGLHPADVARLVEAVRSLQRRGNTVVVVEHEEALIRAADQVVEVGPGAGEQGGQIVFQGTPDELLESATSLTGEYLSGRRRLAPRPQRHRPSHGWIRLAGARGNNLQNVTVEFPLGVLCLVTGVSGAGKSTLIEQTLYPALCRRLRKDADRPLPYDDVFGDGQLEDVVLVDQSPIGRSPRSNPVTYLKAFDDVREIFAETLDARTRGFGVAQFSFNAEAGRCPVCEGDGYRQIDMQFLTDVFVRCRECDGRRYRREILEVRYRGRDIAEVLDLTVREAFTFFRGHPKLQARLKRLIDVGLDYLRLGQPANTLSGGEAQRLKLASYLSTARRGRTLFLLDEPTTGLHFHDVVQLVDCFDALLAVGHSLIVIEHDLSLLRAADWLIDLGPGPGDEGGRVVAAGTPEEVARVAASATGRALREGGRPKADGGMK